MKPCHVSTSWFSVWVLLCALVALSWWPRANAVAQPADKLIAGTNALTTSPEILAAAKSVNEVLIQNDPQSTDDVLVGDSSSQTIQLEPGVSITIPVDNLATVYVVAVAGTPTVNYLARFSGGL